MARLYVLYNPSCVFCLCVSSLIWRHIIFQAFPHFLVYKPISAWMPTSQSSAWTRWLHKQKFITERVMKSPEKSAPFAPALCWIAWNTANFVFNLAVNPADATVTHNCAQNHTEAHKDRFTVKGNHTNTDCICLDSIYDCFPFYLHIFSVFFFSCLERCFLNHLPMPLQYSDREIALTAEHLSLWYLYTVLWCKSEVKQYCVFFVHVSTLCG